MQNHTDYICWTFLHCEFSNEDVKSHWLHLFDLLLLFVSSMRTFLGTILESKFSRSPPNTGTLQEMYSASDWFFIIILFWNWENKSESGIHLFWLLNSFPNQTTFSLEFLSSKIYTIIFQTKLDLVWNCLSFWWNIFPPPNQTGFDLETDTE